MLSADERAFLARWTLANVAGWGGGIVLATALLSVGLLLRVWLPRWALVPLLPLAGALAGAVVGYTQQTVFSPPATPTHWIAASAAGGALGALPGGLLAALVGGTSPLLAQFAAGLSIASGVGFGQAWQAFPAQRGRWQTIYRWALVNGVAGMACAGIAPAGARFWLPLTCILGTGLLGLVTGTVLLRTQRL